MDPLPPAAYALGAPLAEHTARRFNLKGGPLLALAGLAALIISCQTKGASVLIGIAALVLLPFGLIVTTYGLGKRGLRVVRFTDGLLYQDRRQTHAIGWDDILHVKQHVTRNYIHFIYAGKSYAYAVSTRQGFAWVIDDTFERHRELGEHIPFVLAERRARDRQPTASHF